MQKEWDKDEQEVEKAVIVWMGHYDLMRKKYRNSLHFSGFFVVVFPLTYLQLTQNRNHTLNCSLATFPNE